MFHTNGKRTGVSLAAEALIRQTFKIDEKEPGSITCVIYRRNPGERYLFATVLAGLRQQEPMFGPFVWDDERIDKAAAESEEEGDVARAAADTAAGSVPERRAPETADERVSRSAAAKTSAESDGGNPLGFRAREEAREWYLRYPEPDPNQECTWEVHLTGRSGGLTRAEARRLWKDIREPLITLLESSPHPLYPELLATERQYRERLRELFLTDGVSPRLKNVAAEIVATLEEMPHGMIGGNETHIAIYLNTGRDLRRVSPERRDLPKLIETPRLEREDETGDNLNAFEWVLRTTRPVLIQPRRSGNLSEVWEKRVVGEGERIKKVDRIEKAIQRRNFAGMVIAPLLDPLSPARSLGVLCMTSLHRTRRNSRDLCPADVYLLSSLAAAVSAYLVPLLPFQGFPWWPATDYRPDQSPVARWVREPVSTPEKDDVERFAREVAPMGSDVLVHELAPGHSGNRVYHLSITDAHGIPEVPRLMKMGPAGLIADELRRYHRYVSNKPVGGGSRVTEARHDFRERKAAIVYTLVGSRNVAQPFSEWAVRAKLDQLDAVIAKLYEQLSCWLSAPRPVNANIHHLMIVEPAFTDYMKGEAADPSGKEVLDFLEGLKPRELKENEGFTHAKFTHVSVCHGDLHAGNVFALFGAKGEATGVALIDWGSVEPGRHLLSDISKLLCDLVYKVRWDGPRAHEEQRDWAWGKVKRWGEKLGAGVGEWDWAVALIHQTAKLLLYRSDYESGIPAVETEERRRQPYLLPEARQAAWTDVHTLAEIAFKPA